MAVNRAAAAGLAVPIAMGLAAILLPFLILGGAAGATSPPPGQVFCAGAGTGQTIDGTTLDAEQVGNTHTIITITADRHLPAHAATIAVATAMQESSLRNLPAGDADSLGLFQQRPSQRGGTRAQIADPVHATTTFLTHLAHVPNWQTIPLTQAAQAVQRSAHPDAYALWQPLAETLTAQQWPAAAAEAGNPPPTGGAAPPALCAGQGGALPPGGRGNVIAGTTTIPAGLNINGSPAAQKAVRYALAQLGKPYEWGAAGPDAYDCSGLTMAAWATAGTALPHHAADQANHGTPTTLIEATAGDLAFIPGADGTPQAPGHVGMIVGRAAGHLYLIHAPMTGIPVEITDTTLWTGQIVTIRHLG